MGRFRINTCKLLVNVSLEWFLIWIVVKLKHFFYDRTVQNPAFTINTNNELMYFDMCSHIPANHMQMQQLPFNHQHQNLISNNCPPPFSLPSYVNQGDNEAVQTDRKKYTRELGIKKRKLSKSSRIGENLV